MSGPAAPSTHTAQGHAVAREADDKRWVRSAMERQLAVLARLAEVGLAVALAIERQAHATAGPDGGAAACDGEAGAGDAVRVVQGDLALAYARVSRAVRMTLALQSKVILDLRQFDHFSPPEARARQAARSERKDAIERIVGRVVNAETEGDGQLDALTRTVRERLEHDDIYGDILARPVSEIVADICRDLGLDPDWVRLAEEAWAREEIAGGDAGSPLAAAARADIRPPMAASDPFRFAPRAASP